MVEVTLQTQFFIGVIAFVVFSIFIIKTIKNISSINDDGDTIINLDKVSERKRKNKWRPSFVALIVWFALKSSKCSASYYAKY